jgi:hypothetical protein
MATLNRDQLLQVNAVARQYQAIYDEAFRSWGVRAPAPAYCDSVEAVGEFRRNLAVQAKRLLPMSETRVDPREPTFGDLRRAQYRSMADDVLAAMEPSLLKAVEAAGKRNDSVPWGDPLREIHERGPNGEHTIRFLGERSFVHDLKAPVRRVAYFRTQYGPTRTDGLPVQL